MSDKLATEADWAPFVELFQVLDGKLKAASWFINGWTTNYRYVALGNRVIFLLYKEHWSNGAIHFKTRITNTDLDKEFIRVGLHVETSIPKQGINRVVFDKLLLEEGGDLLKSWDRYVIKPTHYQKPFHTWIPFTQETLVSSLESEFSRVQQLGSIIDKAIEGARTVS